MDKERMIMKKKCKACGNKVIVKKDKYSNKFLSPEDCATCRSIGVEKAIEQRLSLRLKGNNTKIKISSKSDLDRLIKNRKERWSR